MPRSPLCTTVGLLITGTLLSAPIGAQTAEARSGDASYRAPGTVVGTGPNGATLRCRDGSHPAPMAPDAACQGKGGVLLRYPVRRTAAPSATPALVTAPAAPTIPAPTPPARVRPTGDGVIPARRPPADATLLCVDGTFITADTAAAACGAHGGVKVRLLKRGTT